MDIQSAEKLNHWKKMPRTNIILKIKKAMFQSFQNELIFSKILVFIQNIFKKQLIIPPFFYENRFIVNFKQKTEFFNSRFSKQCMILNNTSKFPSQCPRKWFFCMHYFWNTWHWKNNQKRWSKQISWAYYAQSLHAKTVGWFQHLDLLFKSCLETD